MVCVLCLNERRVKVAKLRGRWVWAECPICNGTGRSPGAAPSRVTASDAAGGDELASLWVDTNGGEG